MLKVKPGNRDFGFQYLLPRHQSIHPGDGGLCAFGLELRRFQLHL